MTEYLVRFKSDDVGEKCVIGQLRGMAAKQRLAITAFHPVFDEDTKRFGVLAECEAIPRCKST